MKFSLYFQYYHNTVSYKQPKISKSKSYSWNLSYNCKINDQFLYTTVTPFLADSVNNFPFNFF